ncbi:hypothetical protein A3K89_17300 [Rhodococcoides kyotonense]|uniref:Sigma-54 factor interaction domain-containing protein n=2 Tax=Rhodococcoides kyotonense TaxID=398843 RepID=A0A177YLF4_9NOCA|nr:hypothetical protein A3K89_17300 [Rhodococcus kyotonensis]
MAADRVVEHRRAALEQSSSSLAVTDAQGRILNRWVEDDGFGKVLDTQLVSPEYSVAEATTGTTSGGIVLETGQPAMVAGPEHFYGSWLGFTCAGAPIYHPITRRLVGSVNLTVRFGDTSPVLLSWVTDVAADIERALLDSASQRERTLLDAFLTAHRDPRHPVLCLDDQTVIANASASRILSSVDKSLLWEHAWRRLTDSSADSSDLTLESGVSLSVDVTAIAESGKAVGALIKLRERAAPRAARSTEPTHRMGHLSGLVGMTPEWRAMCAEVIAVTAGSVLLMGDPGVGKYAVASALAGSNATILDASEFHGDGRGWLSALGAVEGTCAIVRRLDSLDPTSANSTVRTFDSLRVRGVHIIGTMCGNSGAPNPLVDWFDSLVEVPNLAQRMADLRALLDALTRRHVSGARAIRWSPDVVQTLSRVSWPRNVASLDTFVRETLSNVHKPSVEVSDIPPYLRARASRRALVGLEQVEAKAILQALRDAKGNKSVAADSLGIARSTLYRKVRALGIDLAVSNF